MTYRNRIRVYVPAGSPLDGTTYRVWPESGATTYWTDLRFTSPERQDLEDAFADLRLTLKEALGPHIQIQLRRAP